MIAIKHRFTGATLCEFDVETVKQAAEQGKYNLRSADLCSADLCSADLRSADLCSADLRSANLYSADLRNADLRSADLRGANLCGADLRGANLRGANLHGADLRGANLCGADLCGADLRSADLRGADLRSADLRSANLCGANLCGEKITKSPLSVVGLRYRCLISDGYMRLGCKRFTHDEWANFSDIEINQMDLDALKFWKQWKAPLLAMCSAHKPSDESLSAGKEAK